MRNALGVTSTKNRPGLGNLTATSLGKAHDEATTGDRQLMHAATALYFCRFALFSFQRSFRVGEIFGSCGRVIARLGVVHAAVFRRWRRTNCTLQVTYLICILSTLHFIKNTEVNDKNVTKITHKEKRNLFVDEPTRFDGNDTSGS